jgi:hypothetical protein
MRANQYQGEPEEQETPEQERQREINFQWAVREHELQDQVSALWHYLSEAWQRGANHERPSFEQLVNWRKLLNEVEKGSLETDENPTATNSETERS